MGHYSLHLQLDTYENMLIDSEVIEGLLRELNKLKTGPMSINFEYDGDGWDHLDIKIT